MGLPHEQDQRSQPGGLRNVSHHAGSRQSQCHRYHRGQFRLRCLLSRCRQHRRRHWHGLPGTVGRLVRALSDSCIRYRGAVREPGRMVFTSPMAAGSDWIHRPRLGVDRCVWADGRVRNDAWIFGRKRCAGNVLCRGDHHGACRIMGPDPSSQSTLLAPRFRSVHHEWMNGDGWTTSQAGFAEPAAGVGTILDRAVVGDHRKQSRQRCRAHGWMDIRLRGDGSCLPRKCPQVRAPTLLLYCATLPACCTRFAALWNRGCAVRRRWMELDWRHCGGRRYPGLLRSGTASWQIC